MRISPIIVRMFLLSASFLYCQDADTTETVSQDLSLEKKEFEQPVDLDRLDPWFGFDKVQHTTFSFLWVLSTQYIALEKFELDETSALPISLISAATAGLIKETLDARRPKGWFSKRDLVANGVGILLAWLVVVSGPG